MKKNSLFKGGKYIFSSIFIFCLSVSFCACSLFSNIEVPEKVYVKTDAKFSVAIGEKSVDMNDIFGDSLQERISDEKLEVFKYVPDKNDDTLQYLLHSNIYNFDLDIGEMIGSLNMDDMLSGEEGIKTNEKIQIPEVKSPNPIEWNNNPVKGTASLADDATIPWEIDTNIPLDEVKYIKTAIVRNDASIEIKVANPDGTTGVTLELDSLTISGAGLNFTKSDFVPENVSGYLLFQKLDFENLPEGRRTLNFSQGDNNISITGKINVKIAAGAKCSGLSTKIEVNMKEIEKATADFSDLVKFKKTDESDGASKLPENMLKYVEEVTFGEDGTHYKHEAKGKTTEIKSEGVGIKCEIVNSLPEGNDIDITIISQAFNITEVDSKDWKIHSQGNENPKTENWCVFKDINFSVFDSENPPYMDFEIKLSDNQDLYNLEFGKEYLFSIENTEFVFDWDRADLKLDALFPKEPEEGEEDLSSFSKETLFGDLDGEIGEFIKNNVEFGDGIKAYFYAQKPDDSIIGKITLDGTFDMTYTGKPEGDPNSEYEVFPLSSTMKWKPNDQNEFTTDLKKTNFIKDYDMSKVLKDDVKDLKLKYKFTIKGETEPAVYKLVLDNLEEGASTSISIDAAIVFPLELKIKKGAKLDVLKSADFDEDKKDLFGRESGSNEDYADYLDYISFKYNLKNNVIKGFDFKIEIDDRHTGSEGQEYSGIYEIVDKDEIKFSTSDAKKILSKLFMPKIYLKFDEEKDTDITISRSGLAGENSFSFSPVVAIKLNGDSPICISDILD